MTIEIEEHGRVRLIRWDDGADNRCNAASMRAWHEALDELETIPGPLAVVATGTGKFWSNGLDLDRFQEHPDELIETVAGLTSLLGRLLLFPAYTVCALNGHAFAGGAMITCAFDVRVMREDRGYWCLPEVDIGLALGEEMTAVVGSKMPRHTLADAMLTGHRYSAAEALEAHIVEHSASDADVVPRSLELAEAAAGRDRTVVAVHKKRLYAEAAAVCGIHDQPPVP